MNFPLSFHPLATPPSEKSLLAFRKDAGWRGPELGAKSRGEAQPAPRGRIQWVSVESGKTRIGIARLELAQPEFCLIADLIVSSKYRGRGVGRWLLRNIEQYCGDLGILRLILQATPQARPFYEALHFVPDPHVPALLKKDINPFQRRVLLQQA
jgi:GNAT superfamily N-acetyltransferase